MADVKTMFSGSRRLEINVTGAFSVADETDAVIVDRSALTGLNGQVPSDIRVDTITWSVGVGFDYVLLEWDHTGSGDEAIEYLHNDGYMDYRMSGGKVPANAPAVATDGDILLTTSGGAAGDSYSIYLSLVLKD